MQYTLKPRNRIFDTEVQFPDIPEDKKVAISFSGGMESTLLTKFAIDKYGSDRVRLFVFDNIFNRDVPLQIEVVVNNAQAAAEALGLDPNIIQRFTFDSELHATNRVASLEYVKNYLQENNPDALHLYFGFTNVFFDVEDLNQEENSYNAYEMKSLIDSDPEKFERVIDEFHTDYTLEYLDLFRGMNIKPETYTFLQNTDVLKTPFENLDKGEIVDLYYQSGNEDLLYKTWSCTSYSALINGMHCGACFNCQQRYDGHIHAEKFDITEYHNDKIKKIRG